MTALASFQVSGVGIVSAMLKLDEATVAGQAETR